VSGPGRAWEPLPRARLHGAVPLDYDHLKFLDGRSVLVQPEIFDSQNSVGRRGSLHIVRDPAQPNGCRVEIALEYPEMGDMAGDHGHTERLIVAPAELEPLLLTEFNGAFTYTQRKPEGPTKTAG
jgi:hypothetical protein